MSLGVSSGESLAIAIPVVIVMVHHSPKGVDTPDIRISAPNFTNSYPHE